MSGRFWVALLGLLVAAPLATNDASAFEGRQRDKRGGEGRLVDPCTGSGLNVLPIVGPKSEKSDLRSIVLLTPTDLYIGLTKGVRRQSVDRVAAGSGLPLLGGILGRQLLGDESELGEHALGALLGAGVLGANRREARQPAPAMIGEAFRQGSTLIIDLRRGQIATFWERVAAAGGGATFAQPLQARLESAHATLRNRGGSSSRAVLIDGPGGNLQAINQILVANQKCSYTLRTDGFVQANVATAATLLGSAPFGSLFCNARPVGNVLMSDRFSLVVAALPSILFPGGRLPQIRGGDTGGTDCPPPPKTNQTASLDKVCGPDITDKVFDALDQIIRDYESWDSDTKAAHCASVGNLEAAGKLVDVVAGKLGKKTQFSKSAGTAWDIKELAPGPNNPKDGSKPIFQRYASNCCKPDEPCRLSVEFLSACYHPQVVNYTMWGVMAELCDDLLGTVKLVGWNLSQYGLKAPNGEQLTMIGLGDDYADEMQSHLGEVVKKKAGAAATAAAERQKLIAKLKKKIAEAETGRANPIKECALTCKMTAAEQAAFDALRFGYIWRERK